MKKVLLMAFLVFAINTSYSDQLAWITKEQAEKTVSYFEDEDISRVVIWCACCDNDPKIKVNVERISYKKADDPSYYEIYITGTTSDGRTISQPVDLAYVHVKRSGKWRCLGKELKFDCDPCTKAFKL
ncbi:MAG: hypothetical protein L0Y79_04855 [Chlorobi bacterium]|nr:hypothetical protein [Chlorobiota bacterium]MCI0716591.1 hypothetical protein [Chlorobiota bacterium]